MDRKEIREITGYTFANQQNDPAGWHRSAVAFHAGANVLNQNKESFDGGSRITVFNAAMSIELLLKAIIVARKKIVPRTHTLSDLAKDAEIQFSENQKATLELMGEFILWSGRYPVPTTEKRWNEYQNVTLEKHIIRKRDEGASIALAKSETFPSMANYEALWNQTNQVWNEIQISK